MTSARELEADDHKRDRHTTHSSKHSSSAHHRIDTGIHHGRMQKSTTSCHSKKFHADTNNSAKTSASVQRGNEQPTRHRATESERHLDESDDAGAEELHTQHAYERANHLSGQPWVLISGKRQGMQVADGFKKINRDDDMPSVFGFLFAMHSWRQNQKS